MFFVCCVCIGCDSVWVAFYFMCATFYSVCVAFYSLCIALNSVCVAFYTVCFAISSVCSQSSVPYIPKDLTVFITLFFSHIILIMILKLHFSISHLFIFFLILHFLNYGGGYCWGNHIHNIREFEIGRSEVKIVRSCVFMSHWIHLSNVAKAMIPSLLSILFLFIIILIYITTIFSTVWQLIMFFSFCIF